MVDARLRAGHRREHSSESLSRAGLWRAAPAGAAYLDRSDIRPGMAYPGGVLVLAFSSAGWGWGGNWAGSPDYQHFSVDGR